MPAKTMMARAIAIDSAPAIFMTCYPSRDVRNRMYFKFAVSQPRSLWHRPGQDRTTLHNASKGRVEEKRATLLFGSKDRNDGLIVPRVEIADASTHFLAVVLVEDCVVAPISNRTPNTCSM